MDRGAGRKLSPPLSEFAIGLSKKTDTSILACIGLAFQTQGRSEISLVSVSRFDAGLRPEIQDERIGQPRTGEVAATEVYRALEVTRHEDVYATVHGYPKAHVVGVASI